MKNFFRLSLIVLGIVALFVTSSCTKEDTAAVSFQPVLNQNFSFVVQGNNVVFTTTLTGNVWFTKDGVDYPTVDKTVTVPMPLKGKYNFTCSSLGSGATLVSAPFEVEILQDDLSFLDTEPWLSLTGGQGKTKTWVLDINADGGVTDQFNAPIQYSGKDGDPYFYWDYIQQAIGDKPASDDWSFINWAPAYGANTWLMPAMDYGTMTFDANAGTLTTNRLAEAVANEKGTFVVDKEKMTLTLNGTSILRDVARIVQVDDWQNLRIFHVSANKLCIGVKRVREDDKDSKWVLVYNFVPKTYKDSYVPALIPVPVPEVDLSKLTLKGTWKFVTATPINWYEYSKDAGWAFSNPWNAAADYADWSGYGEAHVAELEKHALTFNEDGTFSAIARAWDATLNDGAGDYAAENSTVTGTYAIDNKGIITFTGKAKFQIGASWMNASTDVTWRLIKQEEDGSVWFGIVEADGPLFDGDAKYKAIRLYKPAKK